MSLSTIDNAKVEVNCAVILHRKIKMQKNASIRRKKRFEAINLYFSVDNPHLVVKHHLGTGKYFLCAVHVSNDHFSDIHVGRVACHIIR